MEDLQERRVRDDLEVVLTAPALRSEPTVDPVRAAVAALDARMRACFHPTIRLPGTTLWRRGVLHAAEESYRDAVAGLLTYHGQPAAAAEIAAGSGAGAPGASSRATDG